MNQIKEPFDVVEYIVLRLLLLGLLGLGAWAVLNHEFNLNKAWNQSQEMINLPSSSSKTRAPMRQQKRRKKRIRRIQITERHPTNCWRRAAGCFAT